MLFSYVNKIRDIDRPTSSQMFLAEVPEHTATGETADIYQQIRRAIGIPNVNLIFRHMATVPGCLPWSWRFLDQLYRSTSVHSASTLLLNGRLENFRPRKHAALSAPPDLVKSTLDSYIRANPINMIGLTVLDHAIAGHSSHLSGQAVSEKYDVTPLTAILPIADLSLLPTATVERLRLLSQKLHGKETNVIPSVFRHFAALPGALETIEDVLESICTAGVLDQASAAMVAQCRSIVVSEPSPSLPKPSATISATIRTLATEFPTNMARMTLVAQALRKAWCWSDRQ